MYLWTCMRKHTEEGQCPAQRVERPLQQLAYAFASQRYGELEHFVLRDSDGLGNPLPHRVCAHLGLVVLHSKGELPEYDKAFLLQRQVSLRKHRTQTQKIRRAAARLGQNLELSAYADPVHLAPHRNSTIQLVAAALSVREWTGGWHYREQIEMLRIMGLSKSPDFVRDRLEYLKAKNPPLYVEIASRAADVRKWT